MVRLDYSGRRRFTWGQCPSAWWWWHGLLVNSVVNQDTTYAGGSISRVVIVLDAHINVGQAATRCRPGDCGEEGTRYLLWGV